jgi:membrane protease YdiL (CAAX protease family)
MLIVSAIFALSHAHLPSLVPLFALAIGLALAYELTGSLLVPIGMHALFNAVMVAKLFIERMQS